MTKSHWEQKLPLLSKFQKESLTTKKKPSLTENKQNFDYKNLKTHNKLNGG